MRVNPPVAIIVLLATVFAFLAFANAQTDCAFTPDGKLRWSALDDWFVDPGYQELPGWRQANPPPCDVWQGIEPSKPIGTIELSEKTAALGSINARITPDGNGFVAIGTPIWDEGPSANLDTGFSTLEEVAKSKTVFEIEARRDLYLTIASLLAPIRDFRGDEGLGPIEDKILREQLGLDDPRTKRLACRRSWQVDHRPPDIIIFGSEERGGEPRAFIDWECDDVAMHGVRYRIRKAYAMLVEEAGAGDYIVKETREKYPECADGLVKCVEPMG